MILPNFIIIGTQKAATTFIHRALREHPEVFMPKDEVTFFEDPDYKNNDIRIFEKLFKNCNKKKVLGIKRPDYLAKPECPKRISKIIPNAKLIAVLRDPIDRVRSAYYHYASIGLAPLKDINIGLVEIIHGEHNKRYPRSSDIIEYGFYHKHLSRYYDYFHCNQISIFLHNHIKEDPLGMYKQVCRFINIDDRYIPNSINTRPAQSVHSINRLKFHCWRNPVLFTYNIETNSVAFYKNFKAIRRVGFRLTNAFDKIVLKTLFKNKKKNLSSEVEKMLLNIYEDDTLKLEEIINQDLSHWKVFKWKAKLI